MPLIHVTMIEGRTAEQKRALLEAVTQAVHETIDAPLESIRAWVTDVPGEQYMVAGTLAAERGADPPPVGAEPKEQGRQATEPGLPPGPAVDPIMGAAGDPIP